MTVSIDDPRVATKCSGLDGCAVETERRTYPIPPAGGCGQGAP